MPTSSSDDKLASRFNFFLEKMTRIRSKIDAAVVNREFSVDFPLCFTRSLTFSHFRLVTEADVLRYMRETRKTCSLDPINVSKLGEAYESAAPAVGAIINSSYPLVPYPHTYIALYSRSPKLPVTHTKNKKLLSIPLKLVPSLTKLPLPYFPPSIGRSASSHPI